MAPALPPFPSSIRFATPDDVDRLADIAFAGGLQTDEFRYQRPGASKFPEDVLDSWRYYLAQYLRSVYDTVIVAEDQVDSAEDESLPEMVPRRDGTKNSKCVVGFAMLKVKASYHNDRVFERLSFQGWMNQGMGRDQHPDNYEEYSSRVAQKGSKVEDMQLSLDTLIVHPAYQRRGHGMKLVSWIKDLAIVDNTVIGIAATRMGIPLYERAGFEKVHAFEVAAGVEVLMMRFKPLSVSKDTKTDTNDKGTPQNAVEAVEKQEKAVRV